MSAITICSGTFCQTDLVVRKIVDQSGYRLVTDSDLTAQASVLSGISEAKIRRAFSEKASVFNKFTHEKERSLAYLKKALAQLLTTDALLISGFTGLFVPPAVSSVLRICLIADMKYRIAAAVEEHGFSEKEARQLVHQQDEQHAAWVYAVCKIKDPWDTALYDMVIPVDKMGVDDIVDLVAHNLANEVIKPTNNSKMATADFLLSAEIEVALAKAGHAVDVSVRNGSVCLTINTNVLMLGRLEAELKSIVSAVPGVKDVETRIGKGFYQADVYRKYDFEFPSKVLLVDDEREFVQTLSERLLMRDVGSAIAYDGESALTMVDEDEPEVMILDLKMPGVDGIEVLRKVKATRPEIEVIILTGHGSEADRKTCMELGAFAYLHKPVDIEVLSDTLKKANEKINEMRRTRK